MVPPEGAAREGAPDGLPASGAAQAPEAAGALVDIHLCVGQGVPLKRVESAEARADFGLWGDRHAWAGNARQVLLVEQEILEALGLAPGLVRENLTTRGVAFNGAPVGARIRVGPVLLEVTGPCRPCALMDQIRPGLKAELVGRRGTLCRVLQGGILRTGDPVVVAREG